tara:strand:- start:116 stop:532 length:417 start_codon:yes stop_codon:yes gene_type:complete
MFRSLPLLIALTLWCATARVEPLHLPADATYERATSGEITLIDIRTPREWQETGVPVGAIALTMHTSKNVFYERVVAAVGGDKSKPVALICAAGNRSRWASNFLAEKGFSRISNVGEGLYGNGSLPGWLERGLPVRKR